jgi:hypothetical protein
MDRYEGPLTAPSLALHRSLYLDIIMDCYEGPPTALTIHLHRGLFLAIIMVHYMMAPYCPYSSLA